MSSQVLTRRRKFLLEDEYGKGYYLLDENLQLTHKDVTGIEDLDYLGPTRIFDGGKSVILGFNVLKFVDIQTGKFEDEYQLEEYSPNISTDFVGYQGKYIFIFRSLTDKTFLHRIDPKFSHFDGKEIKIEIQECSDAITTCGNQVIILSYDSPYDNYSINVFDTKLKFLKRIKIGKRIRNIAERSYNRLKSTIVLLKGDYKEILILNLLTDEITTLNFDFDVIDAEVFPNGDLLLRSSDRFYKFDIQTRTTTFIPLKVRNAIVYDGIRLLLLKDKEIEIFNLLTLENEYQLRVPDNYSRFPIPITLSKEEKRLESQKFFNILEPFLELPKDLVVILVEML